MFRGPARAPLAILAASLAACGGSSVRQPLICPEIAFPAPPKMLYPAPGATGVPAGNFPLVLSFRYGTETSLQSSGAPAVANLQPAPLPSPLPSPAATPGPFASPVAYAVPSLQSAAAYAVIASFSPGPCAPGQVTIGNFTTR